MSGYLTRHGGTRATPQSEPMRDDQVRNLAGGYGWEIDDWSKLRRFLILGSEGGAYYASERDLTIKNVKAVQALAKSDGVRLVEEIVAISDSGRAPKNEPALYALAVAISLGDKETKRAAAEALPKVARIGTHLYHFVAYAETMRGWGRTMRWAVSNWYDRNPEQLALQAIKYRQRDGWSHRDLLRLAHPTTENKDLAVLYGWMAGKHASENDNDLSGLVHAFEAAQRSISPAETAELVRQYGLPREALLPEHLNSKDVWAAMLEKGMPMHAMTRNLATMTRNGILDSREHRALVLDAFDNQEQITRSRLHPMAILIAMETYAQGHGFRGQNTWTPIASVVDALDGAFYKAFGNVTPTGKRLIVAIDASGSMRSGLIAGAPGMTPVKAAMAQALVFVATERDVETLFFDTTISSFPMSGRQRLDDVVRRHPGHGRGTNIALPFAWAIQKNREVDAFITLTDFQTWVGYQHPTQALQEYRNRSGIQAKLAGIAMVSYADTTTDPADPLSFESIGFDAATPELVSGFISGTF